jgi:hypothetical protein
MVTAAEVAVQTGTEATIDIDSGYSAREIQFPAPNITRNPPLGLNQSATRHGTGIMYGLRDFALPSQVVHMYTQLLRSRIRPSLIVVMKQRVFVLLNGFFSFWRLIYSVQVIHLKEKEKV